MATQPNKRPSIATIESGAELRRWYWLKSELSAEAKRLGLKTTGAKFAVLDRICHYHDTGQKRWPGDETAKIQSRFDWHTAELTRATIVTDNYKNTTNVRGFFQAELGKGFRFNVDLLDWFKQNVGRTLGEAIDHWQAQQANPSRTTIKPHNQFNQYCRDLIDDNPTLGMKDARKIWAVKKSFPSETGRHVYEKTDVSLIN